MNKNILQNNLFFILFIFFINFISYAHSENCSVITRCNCIANSIEPATNNNKVPINLCGNVTVNQNVTKYSLNCNEIHNNGSTLNNAIYDEPNDSTFSLVLYYNCTTPSDHSSGYSTGSILVIIFFTLILSYLGLGICVNFFLLGARGIEMLPNLDFWKDFPALVLDGVKFVQNGCSARPSDLTAPTGVEGYDAI